MEPNDFNHNVSRLKLPVPCKSGTISCWNHKWNFRRFFCLMVVKTSLRMITVNQTGLEMQLLFLKLVSKLQMLIINERFLFASQSDFAYIFRRRSGSLWPANDKQRNKTVGKRHSRFTQVTSCCPIWPGSPPRREIEGDHSCCLTPPLLLLPSGAAEEGWGSLSYHV